MAAARAGSADIAQYSKCTVVDQRRRHYRRGWVGLRLGDVGRVVAVGRAMLTRHLARLTHGDPAHRLPRQRHFEANTMARNDWVALVTDPAVSGR
jgi:hypothetical protein